MKMKFILQVTTLVEMKYLGVAVLFLQIILYIESPFIICI